MSALTSLYISQSYGGLIHLSTNTGIVSGTPTQLQDGLGNNLNLWINGNGAISGSSFTGSLAGTSSYAINALTASYALNAASSTSSVAQAVTASGRTIYSVLPGETPTNFNTTQSIILGTQAGVNSSGAYQAVFIGSEAGNSARNAYGSTFIGTSAGKQAREANESIFIGISAGENAVSSSDSIFIGNSTGLNNPVPPGPTPARASGSIFIGASAGQYSLYLDTSIAIGLGAGASQTSTGSRGSIIVGHWAGSNSDFGTNNIIIGNGVTLEPARRDSINIAGIIFGTGSYNNGLIPASTSSPVTNGRIGINKSIPVYSLDVSGSGNYSSGLTVSGSLLLTGSLVINTSGSLVLPLTASASPVVGTMYFAAATKKLFIYDGSTWVSSSLG